VKRTRYLDELLRRPSLALWCLFVAFIPFYVLPSGLPQPGDVLVPLLVPVALLGFRGRLDKISRTSVRPLLWFTMWVLVVNFAWAFLEWKWTDFKAYVIFPIYYFFNFAIFAVALVIYQRFGELFLRLTLYAVFGAVMFQVGASFLYQTGLYRSALFFNNANQLGYYALLAASLIAMCQRRLGFGIVKASIGVTGCAYLALLSASRSAVAGIAILLFLLVFSSPRVIIVASLAAVVLTIGGPVAKAIDTIEARMNRHRKTTFIEERGYDRLWEYKEYAVLGAGEGDVQRFVDSPRKYGHEIHSSFATVLFSYGLIGFGLFCWFIVTLLRGSTLRNAVMLIPTLAQTVAHQGLRFTMLWVLFAIFVALKVPAKTGAPARAATTPRPPQPLPAPA
jgi:hypothetical protein